MPRDNDKDNASRGRRDRPPGGKGRSGRARGPEKKFAKRDDAKPSYGKKLYSGSGKPYAGNHRQFEPMAVAFCRLRAYRGKYGQTRPTPKPPAAQNE